MFIFGQDGVDIENGVCYCDIDWVNVCDDDADDDGDDGRVVDGGACDDGRDCSDDCFVVDGVSVEGGCDDHSLVCSVGCYAGISAGGYVGCNAPCKYNSI